MLTVLYVPNAQHRTQLAVELELSVLLCIESPTTGDRKLVIIGGS